ncbi:hypothetical protein CkaCkLH20_06314 [Colletotrichum karsti]|uniref:FAD-binding domain-containing protein n=1 Tax=Colletotrichum karsti TaxID=1095194 RepID=A0A9P6I781_9PEZI|nr:uncharacterized protein CkaCkLH20_06314 [Colletotrichum karsti]KAF9876371.1 hypothetical protein CkaCkLH20_06314 [Colletotrichum karsti]
MERDSNSGISILIVGGGIAGLTLAIESYRKGHNVKVIERRDEAKDLGELIVISAPALRTPMKSWPGFMEKAKAHALDPLANLWKFDGTLVGTWPVVAPDVPVLVIYRSKLHQVLHEYAEGLGIVTNFSHTAVSYFEEEGKGGVVVEDGRRLTADVVVAADGVGSRSWELVLGEKQAPISSGFALYRVTFPIEPLYRNPVLAEVLQQSKTYFCTFAGPDAHIVIGKTETEICWLLTHRDEEDSEESWSKTTSCDDALRYVKNWSPFVKALIDATPDHRVLSWKVMWRDPQPKWVSALGRVVQIGDAAHPFLPTSGSGATMAMEDAITLATCLRISGKDETPTGVKVFNKLRFERVACAQKLGFKTREVLHKTDWDYVKKHPEIMKNRLGGWLLKHDPEDTNGVPGYTYKPWTVKELLDASDKGQLVEDEGNWM